MKSVRWILASAFMSLVAVACVAPTTGGDESQPQADEPVGEAEQALDQMRTTIYYAEAAHINQVGYCVWMMCPPRGTTCSGIKTAYTEVYYDPCY